MVLPALVSDGAEVVECWGRRYRCLGCGAVAMVLPHGVMKRYLYSAAAIVVAFFLKAKQPIGQGLSAVEAYGRQGMYRRPPSWQGEGWRWHSIGRWQAHCRDWWPDDVAKGVAPLLSGFVARSETGALADVILTALRGHAEWGLAV